MSLISGMSFRPQTTAVVPSNVAGTKVPGASAVSAGHVWWPSRTGTKNIVRVQFGFNTVVKSHGTGLRISLQNLHATSPLTNDGTVDQFVDIANSDPGFVANAWYRTAPLSASRTVSFGEGLAVVYNYDPAGLQAGDSILVEESHFGSSQTHFVGPRSGANCILEFDDGTFGTFFQSAPTPSSAEKFLTAVGDEYALEFSVPKAYSLDGCSACIAQFGSSNIDVILYDASSHVLRSTSLPYRWLSAGGSQNWHLVLFSSYYDLIPDRLYRLSAKLVSGTNGYVEKWSYANKSHQGVLIGGTAWRAARRSSGGCWTTVRTERPLISPHLASW